MNNDGIININDRTVTGNALPSFTYGLTNNLSYKGFSLDVLVQGVKGNEIYNSSKRYLLDLVSDFNQAKRVVNRWRSPENPGDGIIARAYRGNPADKNLSQLVIEDGSFVRIRNISLGYNLPGNLMKSISVQGVRVYISVQNVKELQVKMEMLNN